MRFEPSLRSDPDREDPLQMFMPKSQAGRSEVFLVILQRPKAGWIEALRL